MKYWRGDYVIVFPEKAWQFHTCVVCGSKLRFGTDSADTGLGPECARKSAVLVTAAKERALERDRLRYRAEVLDLGFKIERPK